MRHITIVFLLLLYSCGRGQEAAYIYDDASMWYRPTPAQEKAADIFYVTPTCIWDYADKNGTTHHNMNPKDSSQRAAVDYANRLAYNLFGESCNFFSPYYRQMTMNPWFWTPSEFTPLLKAPQDDIKEAFSYFIENINRGERPFILAGHSQGGRMVLELLKQMSGEVHERMVAAYIFGWEVTDEDAGYQYVIPAADSLDRGGTICINSVARVEAVSPLLSHNTLAINPLSWQRDTVTAGGNLGCCFFDFQGQLKEVVYGVTAKVDIGTNTLVVGGLNPDKYYHHSIEKLFGRGNYHIEELNLYFLNIKQNVARRIAAARDGSHGRQLNPQSAN